MEQIGINDNEDGTVGNGVLIPNYMRQLFSHLIEKMRTDRMIMIIASEMKLLNTDLQKQLLTICDFLNEIQLSSFMKSIINVKNISVLEEYYWILSDQELKQLKKSRADKWLYCNNDMIYKMRGYDNDNIIKFTLGLCRCANGRTEAGYCIYININIGVFV